MKPERAWIPKPQNEGEDKADDDDDIVKFILCRKLNAFSFMWIHLAAVAVILFVLQFPVLDQTQEHLHCLCRVLHVTHFPL